MFPVVLALGRSPVPCRSRGRSCNPRARSVRDSRRRASLPRVFDSSEEVTFHELAHRAKGLTGSSADIIPVPDHQAYGSGFEDMPRCVPKLEGRQEDRLPANPPARSDLAPSTMSVMALISFVLCELQSGGAPGWSIFRTPSNREGSPARPPIRKRFRQIM